MALSFDSAEVSELQRVDGSFGLQLSLGQRDGELTDAGELTLGAV